MTLEQFAQMRALETAYTSTNRRFVDHLLQQDEKEGGKVRDQLKLRRLQFDTSELLYAEVEQICGLLDCSKREFLEGAIADALERAKRAYFDTLAGVAPDLASSFEITALDAQGETPATANSAAG